MSRRVVGGRTMAGLGHPAISAMYAAQDLKEQLVEDALRNWDVEETHWQEKCAEIEGTSAFLVWFADDNNIPDFGKASERVMLLKAHYDVLKVTHADAFYWLKVEKQEAGNCIEIEGAASFREWWNNDANFPSDSTPKDRVEMIRARIAKFLENDGTTQVQARVRVLRDALASGKVNNIVEVTSELANLVDRIQKVGAPMDEGG